MNSEDKVIIKDDLGVSVGNFNIDSNLLENNISPFLVNKINKDGSSFKTIFSDLAIPTSLYILESLPNKSTNIVVNDTDEIVDDKIYDRLLSLLSNNKQINHNRASRKKRHKETKSKKTRKNK